MSDTVSADSIKAQMPHAILTRVLGEPTHKQVKMVIRELTANLMAVPVLGVTTRDTLGSFKIRPSTWLETEMRTPSLRPNLQHTPSFQSAPLSNNARNYAPSTSPRKKHGLPTALSSPSLGTSSLPPSTMSTTPFSMIQRKDSTASTSARWSNTS